MALFHFVLEEKSQPDTVLYGSEHNSNTSTTGAFTTGKCLEKNPDTLVIFNKLAKRCHIIRDIIKLGMNLDTGRTEACAQMSAHRSVQEHTQFAFRLVKVARTIQMLDAELQIL